MSYPVIRNLDRIYFRVKRDDKFVNLCFTDLTEEERQEIIKDRSNTWLASMCLTLADCLRDVGDTANIEIENWGELQ